MQFGKYLITIILFGCSHVYAQLNYAGTGKFVNDITAFYSKMPSEKVYLHIDRPFYCNTDTIWMKAYILNAALEPTTQSGLLYVELVNNSKQVAYKQCMPVFMGISYGQLALDSVNVPEGGYTLRAYTNWMQNTGTHAFFTRALYINKADNKIRLIKTVSSLSLKKENISNNITLQMLEHDGTPMRLKNTRLSLVEGDKIWLREQVQTDVEGKANISVDIPKAADGGRLTLLVEEGGKTSIIPVPVNRPEYTDVQFMPEGGNLVAGLTSKVAFKAIGEDGKGVAVNGIIVNKDNKEIAAFKSSYHGMGNFIFTPENTGRHTAIITLPNGTKKEYPFPQINQSGIVLGISNIAGRDSIIITMQATNDIVATKNEFSLIAQSRDNVCYASAVKFNSMQNTVHGLVAKSKFPTGISRFTVLNNNSRPVAERLVFINHHDELSINLKTNKSSYKVNDSVKLSIGVNNNNKPVADGSFSLSVADDSLVMADSSNIQDIRSYMLTAGELKGDIENPGYYFDNPSPETDQALDNLLLTQGWAKYNWDKVFDKSYHPAYVAEKEIAVTGTVKRLNKPQAGIKVSLLSTRPVIMLNAVTDSIGRFAFTNLPRIDTPAFIIQAKDKKGKLFDATVETDDFKPADTKSLVLPVITPWYVNTSTIQRNYINRTIAAQQLAQLPGVITQLNEVTITANKIIKGSKNLNGPGVADQVLDEESVIKAGKLSLPDILSRKVKGFGVQTLPTPPGAPAIMFHSVYDKQVKFIFDGVDLDAFFQPLFSEAFKDFEHYNFVRSFLELFNATDIKGVEVLYREAYVAKYKFSYESQSLAQPECRYCTPPRYKPLVYVEITTWSGNGLSQHRKNGLSLYRPMPVTWPEDFYKPKYTGSNNVAFNMRPTIHWEPNIITDKQGKATVVFYTKNKPGNYTLIVQGSDLNGSAGSTKMKLKVE